MWIGQKLGINNLRERFGTALERWLSSRTTLQTAYSWLEFRLAKSAIKKYRYFSAVDHLCKSSRRSQIDSASRIGAREQLKLCFKDSSYLPQSELLKEFRDSEEAARLRVKFIHRPFPKNVVMGGTALPLKAWDPHTGEKGVLLLTYNYTYRALHAIFRTEEMRNFYTVVLEPSFYRFEDPVYALYRDWNVVIESRSRTFRGAFEILGKPFDSVEISAGEWVDSDVFHPIPEVTKTYDLLYVASYSRCKRHEVLFEALAKIKRPLRVALVGARDDRTREFIESEMRRFRVADQCEIFAKIPPAEINALMNRSRLNLLMSSFECANRVVYEAMFANLPSVVNRDCAGMDLSYINEFTGIQASDAELADAIVHALGHPNGFNPRAWGMEHCSYVRSTRLLNEKLKEAAFRRGEPWTNDIAVKVNCSDPTYKSESDAERLKSVPGHLAQFLR